MDTARQVDDPPYRPSLEPAAVGSASSSLGGRVIGFLTLRRTPRRHGLLRILGRRVGAATLTFLVLLLVVPAMSSLAGTGTLDLVPGTSQGIDEPEHPAHSDEIEKLNVRYDCSYSGLGQGVIPAHAIVLTEQDEVVVTTFAHGWAVFEKQKPGTLISVCRL